LTQGKNKKKARQTVKEHLERSHYPKKSLQRVKKLLETNLYRKKPLDSNQNIGNSYYRTSPVDSKEAFECKSLPKTYLQIEKIITKISHGSIEVAIVETGI